MDQKLFPKDGLLKGGRRNLNSHRAGNGSPNLETPLCSYPGPFPSKTFVIKVNFPLVNTGHVPFLVQCPESGTINHVAGNVSRNKGVECPTLTYAPDARLYH